MGGVADPLVELGGGVAPDGLPHDDPRRRHRRRRAPGSAPSSSHDVVAAPACLVAHPTLAALLPTLRLDPDVEPTLRVSVATGDLAARWDAAAGNVRGPARRHALGPGRDALRGRRRAPPARVDGLVLPVRPAGRRAARRHRAAGGAGAGQRRPRRRRLRRHRHVRRRALTDPLAAGDRRRDVAVGGRRRPVQPARPQGRGHHGRGRRLADRRPTTAVDVVIADPARSGLGKPGVAALTRIGDAGARARQLRPGVARPRRQAARRRRLPPRALRGGRHVPAHDPRRGRQPLHPGADGRLRP